MTDKLWKDHTTVGREIGRGVVTVNNDERPCIILQTDAYHGRKVVLEGNVAPATPHHVAMALYAALHEAMATPALC